MNLSRAASIDDLRRMAMRRVPRFVFDFFDGAAETEGGMDRNQAAFARRLLVPHLMRKVEERDLGVDLFGRRWAAPIGIAPTGLTGLIWPGADLHKARTAAAMNLPFLLSTASSHTIEEVAAVAPEQTWFQLYAMRDMEIVGDLLSRAKRAGVNVLVVTVDLPAHGKRERDIRNGFVLPLRLTWRNVLEFLRCPRWSLATLRAGPPRYANFEQYFQKNKMKSMSRTAFIASQAGGSFDLNALDALRDLWSGKLVVKGLISPSDIAEMSQRGIDGVIVSNHGGRQFDAGPAPIDMIPAAVEAADGKLEVMLDSGIRRGSDVVRTRLLGGSFAFAGRAPLYGLAAGMGQDGTDKAMQLLVDEIDRCLAMLGCRDFNALGPQHMMPVDAFGSGGA